MNRLFAAHLGVLVALALAPAAPSAQSLQPKRDIPAITWPGCPTTEPPTAAAPAQRQFAERLAGEATQASLLGDVAAASDLLARAAALDPASATIAYRHARVLDDLNRRNDALKAYCRYIDIAPDAPDAPDVRARMTALSQASGFTVAPAAVTAFQNGLDFFDAGRLTDAATAFGAALVAAPEWGAPAFNRGVVRLALQQPDAAEADLRHYLELSPGAADFSRVLDLVGALRAPVLPPFNPGRVLATGLVAPGLGHFTTERPVTGALVLAGAVGALAVGIMSTRVDVECLSPPADGQCPAGQVLRERRERPYLLPAAGAAVGIGVLGAIDAYRGAKRRNALATQAPRVGGLPDHGISIAFPDLQFAPDGAVIALVRLRF